MREKLIELVTKAHNAVTDKCIENGTWSKWGMSYAEQIETETDSLIANGVVIPVRCKDCKYMEKTPDSLRWCNVWSGINGMGDEGFCSYGERKQDEQNSL